MPVERFHVRLLPEEGGSERVSVEVGMEGFNVMSTDGSRTLRKYPLHHIARWSMRGSRLILFTRSPVSFTSRLLYTNCSHVSYQGGLLAYAYVTAH